MPPESRRRRSDWNARDPERMWVMSAVVEEPVTLEVVFSENEIAQNAAWLENRRQIVDLNREASEVGAEALAAFLELLAAADSDYIDTPEYAPAAPQQLVDWESVSQALVESQQILICVQKLLSETLAAMGVEEHQFIRVYADSQGMLRLVADHPRRDEIENVLNSPDNHELRAMHQAAVAGMSLAGGLVGTVSAPAEVLEQAKAQCGAA